MTLFGGGVKERRNLICEKCSFRKKYMKSKIAYGRLSVECAYMSVSVLLDQSRGREKYKLNMSVDKDRYPLSRFVNSNYPNSANDAILSGNFLFQEFFLENIGCRKKVRNLCVCYHT